MAKKSRAEGIFSIRNNELNETDEICILKMFVYFVFSLFRMKKKGFVFQTEAQRHKERWKTLSVSVPPCEIIGTEDIVPRSGQNFVDNFGIG